MPPAKIHFKGLLSNVDSSILDMVFERNFKVESFPAKDGIDLISKIGVNPNKTFLEAELREEKKCIDYSVNRLGDIYFISNVFDDIVIAEDMAENYLRPLIRILRLFKEGSINLPIMFHYSLTDEITNLERISFSNHIYCTKEKYSLQRSEIPCLMEFLDNVKKTNENLIFNNPALQNAYEAYDLSYYAHSTAIGLLDLTIGLEALLNPTNEGELKFRIARNAAILIGKDKEDSKTIYRFIKNIYDKRSNLVHTGRISTKSSDRFSIEDFSRLRNYLRESIKKFHNFCIHHPHKSSKGKYLEKEDLLSILEYSDFGESPVDG